MDLPLSLLLENLTIPPPPQIKVMLDVDDEEDNDDDKEKDKQEETKEEIDATVDDSSHSSEGELTTLVRKASKEKAQEDKKRGITQSNLEFNAWVVLEQLVNAGKLDSLLPYPIHPAEDNRTTISDLTSIVAYDPPARENESGVPVTLETVGSSEGERIASTDTVGQFGRDGIVISQEALIERRRRNGECPTCGQKCFKKKIFKWVPLTIEGRVLKGRCLLCTNNDGRNESDMDDDAFLRSKRRLYLVSSAPSSIVSSTAVDNNLKTNKYVHPNRVLNLESSGSKILCRSFPIPIILLLHSIFT